MPTAATMAKRTRHPPSWPGRTAAEHSCKIAWKEGKNLTVTIETKKQRHKGPLRSAGDGSGRMSGAKRLAVAVSRVPTARAGLAC